jgi:microcystin-dependent protein
MAKLLYTVDNLVEEVRQQLDELSQDAVSTSGSIFYTTNRSFNNYGAMTTSGISANHTHSFSTGGVSANHTHSFTTDNGTGSATPVPNLQPYIVVNYIIKI